MAIFCAAYYIYARSLLPSAALLVLRPTFRWLHCSSIITCYAAVAMYEFWIFFLVFTIRPLVFTLMVPTLDQAANPMHSFLVIKSVKKLKTLVMYIALVLLYYGLNVVMVELLHKAYGSDSVVDNLGR